KQKTAYEILRATSISVFALQGVDEFAIETSSGLPPFTSLKYAKVSALIEFTQTCVTSAADSILRAIGNVTSLDRLSSIISTFVLDGVPILILYIFPRFRQIDASLRACGFVSREIFHLLRSSELRLRYETMKSLTEIRMST